MARFFPTLDLAEFRSKGECSLFQELAALDDGFTVIHSLPWLRGRTKRVYSQSLHQYLKVSTARNHLSGEVDFVILHAELGILCIETKSGLYKPSGYRFIHEDGGYEVDPLNQVKDNTFAIVEMLKSWQINCPVGYAVHLPEVNLEKSQIASAYVPFDRPLPDGILIMQNHRRDIPSRIVQLMEYWKVALNYDNQDNFSSETDRFLDAVWPLEARVGHLGRKIIADGELWLQLDAPQAKQVASCSEADRRLIAGFSGSGKTLIARSLAEKFAAEGLAVLFLLKNRKITQKVTAQLSHLSRTVTVQTFHSYCEGRNTPIRADGLGDPNYDEYHLFLHGTVDSKYAVLIVDEAQALNEVDHIALRDHFVNARKFIFADEFQVLPGIEKGSSYRFLEDTYNERFFYLATVYRNPKGITNAMLEIREPQHEVNCPRPISKEDLSRSISWDVPASIRALTAKLSRDGVMTKDIIVLSQFLYSLDGINGARSSISAYRGMETPVVIIVVGSDIDDASLACALGRATTSAYIIVPVEMLADLSRVKSDFLRKSLEKTDRGSVFEQDSHKPAPRFIANRVQKYAGAVGRHEIFGEGFFYASQWRQWVYEGGGTWANRGVQLWGWWLSLSTGLPISGIDSSRNKLSDSYLLPCKVCGTMTPHDAQNSCNTCLASPLDDARISGIILQAADLSVVRSMTQAQSLINVAALVGNFQFPHPNDSVHGAGKIDALFLANTIIEFWMLRKARVATKSQIMEWLQEVLVTSELDSSLEALAGRAIGSLCGQQLLAKIGTGRYQLIEGC